MKILSIDYGDSRTGIAISDPLGFMAGRSFVINEKYPPKLVLKISEVLDIEKPSEIILGYPKNMNGTLGERAVKTEEFKTLLEEKTSIPIILWDERTTTISAHQILHSTGKKQKNHKKTVDAVAASLILEGYLRYKSIKK